jgi:cobalt-zinc-cadmium efflux system outer membrane protein
MRKLPQFRYVTAWIGAAAAVLLGGGPVVAEEIRPSDPSTPGADVAGARVPIEALLTDPARLAAWIAARHPDVAAAEARVEQAEAGLGQSRAVPNPTLGVAVGGLSVGARNPSSLRYEDTLNWSVGVSETIELGKRGPRAAAATLRRDAARASARDVLAEKLADARDALARVVYLAERQRVLEERLRSARSVASLERVRLQHGDISGIDLDRLELDVSIAVRQHADNQSDAESAMADCSTVLAGRCAPGDATMATVDASAPVAESYPGLAALVAARPDIRAVHLASSAARTDAVLRRRQAIPDPTVGVSYTRDYLVVNGNQPSTLTASVSLPLPLFDHGQHLARQAEGMATELGHVARALEMRAAVDARSLLVRRDVLREKLATLMKDAIPRGDAVLKSSDEAYHRGQLSLTDLLLVRREHASLLLDAIDTRYELFAVRNSLHRTLGLGVPPGAPGSRPEGNP